MQKEAENQYLQLHQHFNYLINQGALKAGEKLPSEREIGEQFNLTRVTVRQALQTLEADGLIYRMNRKGWFVSPSPLSYNPAKRQSFIEYSSNQGFTPSTELLHQSNLPADTQLSELFEVQKGTKLLLIHRRRSVDGRPVLLEHIYINPDLLPNIEHEDLSQSLTELLRRNYNETYDSMDLTFKSTALPADAAQALEIPSGLPGLHLQRTSYSADGRVLEVDFEFWRHDAVTIEINVTGG